MRTYDMMKVAAALHSTIPMTYSPWRYGVAPPSTCPLRFLKGVPWKRLEFLPPVIPNICFSDVAAGSNAVGYTAYPDNLIVKFIEEAAEAGIDIFRIFDLNWVEAMKVSIRTVRERTNSVAEACICYTGDISPSKI